MSLHFADFTELRAHLSGLCDARITTSGTWDPGQICYHLAASFEATCDSTVPGGSRWMRLVRLPQRLFVMRVGFPSGVPIPEEVRERIQPPAEVDMNEQLQRLQRAIDRFDAMPGGFPPHPVFGPLTRGEWRKLHLRHCELHLKHVKMVNA